MTGSVVKLLSDGYFEIDLGLLIYGKTQYYGIKYMAALKPLLIITPTGQRILVDTGIGELPPKYTKYYKLERKVTLIDSLRNLDINPDDISVVVNTHLHFDHCGNNKLFKNAKFYVQTVELEYARNPDRFQKGGYVPELFDVVNYTTINGEFDVAPGIRVIPTPGHTPGHQSVIVKVGEPRRKCYVYCGDVAPLRENLESRNIVGILYNPRDALASIDKLRNIDGDYIYSHDRDQLTI
jgi:glyoxylase-like metal-dependent hydrolase (beta-lactamase superfamily II)